MKKENKMVPILFTLGFVVVAILVYKSFSPFSTIRSKPDIISYIMLWIAFFMFKLPIKVIVIYGIALIVCIVIWHFIQEDRDMNEAVSNDLNRSVSNGLDSIFGSGDNIFTGFVKNKLSGALHSNKQECEWVDVGKAVNVIYFLAVLICTIVIAIMRND